MTDNLDEFDHEEMDPSAPPRPAGVRENLAEAWRTRPLFKLLVIMLVVGVAIAGALGVFSGSPPPERSNLVKAPSLNEPPGGKSSPYFIEQNDQANKQRADQAMQTGSSAMPTPPGQSIDINDLTDKNKKDPLVEFRAETERLKHEMQQEKQQNAQQIQALQQQVQQPVQPVQRAPEPEDDSLAKAMQKQMQELMSSWTPREMKIVAGATPPRDATQTTTASAPLNAPGADAGAAAAAAPASKNIVQPGTVNYGQLLTEANSDIPGPILAQILSGPLKGGRAIGQFQVMNDYLVLTFNLVNLKGKDYAVQILALNPDTTLGGMATEVDHRYFDRLLLPAAGQFLSQFGSALGQGSSTTTVSDGTVMVDQAQKSMKQAMYSGLGQVGQTAAQFLQNEASQIKPLVRVAVGTPMGLFFLTGVKDDGSGPPAQPAANPLMAQGNQAGGYYGASQGGAMSGQGAIPGYAGYGGTGYGAGQASNSYGSGTSAGYGYNPASMGYNPGTQQQSNNGITIITPGQSGVGIPNYGH